MMNPYATSLRSVLLAALVGVWTAAAQGAPSVRAVVRENEVYVGEAFDYQIQVDNVSSASPPDLTVFSSDFSAVYQGGNRNDSRSLSIINGRTTQTETHQYQMNFRLTALRTGLLTIPSVPVAVEGQTYSTQPIQIRANKPGAVEGLKLLSTLSKDSAYVGQPLTLTTTLYIGQQIRTVDFSAPAISADGFESEPVDLPNRPGHEYYTVPVNGQEAKAEKGSGTLDGQQYVTLTFQYVLVPLKQGDWDLPNSTVTVGVPTGRRQRPRSIFDDMSIFNREEIQSVVVPGNAIHLEVKPVPAEGKPTDFSGLIGAVDISTTATPTDVSVGDPITLTVTLKGSPYLHHFELPSLQGQPALAADFRIPQEMAPGRSEGDKKVFTQTLRAESDAVKAIPPVTLSYFDADTGTYATASSAPIPLTVHPAQVVTASDAEGYQQPVESVEHVAVNSGIAHNFTEKDSLRPQHYGPDVWMRTPQSWLLLLLPPLLYTALAVTTWFRRNGGLHGKGRARKQARAQLESALDSVGEVTEPHGAVLDALRQYLGAKLGLNASALIFSDIQGPLSAEGVSAENLAALEELFAECEAHRYAGTPGAPGETSRFIESTRTVVRALDKEIG